MNGSDTISEVSYFTGIDYGVLAFILSFSLAIGIYFGFFSDKLKTAEDYLVGGHKMKAFPIAISLCASQISAISIIAIPAEIYSFGWQYCLVIPMLIPITISINYLFLPVFYHNNIDNCYAYLELRFGKSVREFVTIIFIFVNIFLLPVIMFIPSLSFVEVTKLNIHVVNTFVCYVCVLYTMLGGIRAVVWTDVAQAVIMVSSVVIVALFGIFEVGGLHEVWNRAVNGGRIHPPDFSLDLVSRTTFWNTVSYLFCIWICHVGFSQCCIQRLVSLPSLQVAKKSMVIFLLGVIFFLTFNCGTGIIMYAYYHDCDPVKANIVTKYDKLMPRFVRDVAGHITGMSGVFMSCVFSASLSTVSAALHSMSGVIYNDYIRKRNWFAHTDSNANLTMRIIIFLIGTFCALSGIIVERFQSIFQVITTVAGMYTTATFGVFTLGMLYPWANRQGVMSGMIICMAFVFGIIVNTQINIAKGNLHYDILPTSIDGCSDETIARFQNETLLKMESVDDGFAFYKIAFLWYPLIGVISMWIPSIIISYLTGGQDFTNFNVQLLAPCIQNWVPKKYHHREVKLIQSEDGSHINDNKNKTTLETEWISRKDEKADLEPQRDYHNLIKVVK